MLSDLHNCVALLTLFRVHPADGYRSMFTKFARAVLFTVTLHDVCNTSTSMTLVFEFLEKDLKQYMEDCNNVLSLNNVKVRKG